VRRAPIQAFVSAAKLGRKPTEYVTSISIDRAVMQIVHVNAGPQAGVGATSTAFLLPGLKLTTSPTDYYPIGETHLVRYLHGYWNVLGKPLKTS